MISQIKVDNERHYCGAKKAVSRVCIPVRKCHIKILSLVICISILGRFSRVLFHTNPRVLFHPQNAHVVIDNMNVNVEGLQRPRKRPMIYTFFSRIDSDKKQTGMDDQADADQLALWTAEWNLAGWDTVVLNLDHAKLHPRFHEFQKALEKVPLEGKSGKNRAYNELCYLRWLAVAIMGGGWMSDYDLFPLPSKSLSIKSMMLPNDGKFTVYSTVEGGGGIPCLMSGSAEEWNRLAGALLNNAIQHTDTVLWSDMFALMDLRHQDSNAYIGTKDVIPGASVLVGRDWKDSDCKEISNGKMAVHFSHDALHKGDLSNIDGADDHPSNRPFITRSWFKMWKETCDGFRIFLP